MGIELLDKTRKISKLLHNNSSSVVVFDDICGVLSEILSSNVLVISRKGKVLGNGMHDEVSVLRELITNEVGSFVDGNLNERLINILSTKENVNVENIGFSREAAEGITTIIVPIIIAEERLGTLFLYRNSPLYSMDDIVISEYGTTVVGLEMLRSLKEESAAELRKESSVHAALSSLSSSELEAIVHIFEELEGDEGVLVASKIADRAGITRSVFVNALRKLESSGVIVSKSSGMKGTYIKVVNEYIYDILDDAVKNKERRGSE